MGFEQDLREAYRKLRGEMKKLKGPRFASYEEFKEELLSEVGKLGIELTRFAKEFDRKLVNAKFITGAVANEIFSIMQDDFVDKLKDFLDKTLILIKKVNFDADCYEDISREVIRDFEYLKETRIQKYKNICSFLEDWIGRFNQVVSYLKMLNPLKTPADFAMYSLKILSEFFVDILEGMDDYFAEEIEAKDEDYFIIGDDSGYFSKAMSYLFPKAWSWWNQRGEKHVLTSAPEDAKIFPSGEPKPGEVEQAGIGDCYLMAALIALAKSNPQVIKDCFVQGTKDIDEHDIITVRFFGENHIGKWGPIHINVDKKKVASPECIRNGALWPKIIEKAYMIYEQRPYWTFKRTNIHGGSPRKIFMIMTGKISGSKWALSSKYYDKGEKIISKIKSKLENHQAITCDFSNDFKITDAKSGETIPILDGHSYAIVGVVDKNDSKNKTGKTYVRLIEPNRAQSLSRSPRYNNKKKDEGGHIAMFSDDFCKNYKFVQYAVL